LECGAAAPLFFVMQITLRLSTDAAPGGIVKPGKISLLDRADVI
jgi:hypothetical protein